MGRLFANLAKQKNLSGLDADAFADKAAHFLAELNAIHRSAKATAGRSCRL
jgi:cell filamentation protein